MRINRRCVVSGIAVLWAFAAFGSVPAEAQNRFRGMNPQNLLSEWPRTTKAERPLIAEALLENRANSVSAMRAATVIGDRESKLVACAMLGQLRDTGSVPALLAASDDADAGVQARAVTALRLIGDRSAAPRLRKLLNAAPDRAVLKRTLVALGRLGSATDVNRIRPFLADADVTVQVIAAGALAMLGNLEGQDFLLAAIDGDDPLAQKNATFALGYLDTVESRTRLAQILADPDGRWKSYAVMAQAQQDRRTQTSAQAAALLDGLARGRDRLVAMWAIEELSELGPDGEQVLQQLETRRGVRATAARFRLQK